MIIYKDNKVLLPRLISSKLFVLILFLNDFLFILLDRHSARINVDRLRFFMNKLRIYHLDNVYYPLQQLNSNLLCQNFHTFDQHINVHPEFLFVKKDAYQN